jgi:hypothetical protein
MNALPSQGGVRQVTLPTRAGAGQPAERLCVPRDDPLRNALSASLPASDYARWLPTLKLVEMPFGRVLHESGAAMTNVYFPVTAVVSILYLTEDGASTEVVVMGT